MAIDISKLPKTLGSSGQQAIKNAAATLSSSGISYKTPTQSSSNLYVAGNVSKTPLQKAAAAGTINPVNISSSGQVTPRTSPVTSSFTGRSFMPDLSSLYTPPKVTGLGNFSSLLRDLTSGNTLSAGIGALGSGLNLPEFGVSELVRGLMDLQAKAGIPSMGILSKYAGGYESPYGKAAASGGFSSIPTSTGGSPNPGQKGQVLSTSSVNTNSLPFTRDPLAGTRINLDTSKYNTYLNNENQGVNDYNTSYKNLSNYLNDPNSSSTGIGSDLYGLFDQQNQDLANQGFSDAQSFYTQLADLRKSQARAVYDNLVKQYEGQIPNLENDLNTQVARQSANLKDLQTQGDTQKTELGNVYGDIIKGIVANKNVANTNLKNMFSALGTAESSDFLNRAGQLESGATSDIASTQREQASKLSAIDTALATAQRDTNNAITDLQTQFNQKKQQVQNLIDSGRLQEAQDVENISQDLATQIQGLKDFYAQKASDLLTAKQSLLSQQDLLNQQLVGNLALNNQTYQQNLQLARMQNVPTDLQQELDRYKFSSITPAATAALKAKYPSWADLIDSVAKGGSSSIYG